MVADDVASALAADREVLHVDPAATTSGSETETEIDIETEIDTETDTDTGMTAGDLLDLIAKARRDHRQPATSRRPEDR